MAINLEKHREALIAAWKEVLDEKSDINWALFGYEGLSNDLKFVSKGDGGLSELVDDLNSGKIQYAFLKVDVPNGSIPKYVLINWQGEGAPTVRKGTCANHVKHVAQLFSGFHLTMHARTEDDLDERLILEKLAKAGSAFDFKANRQSEAPPSGPVGTSYRKVNPGSRRMATRGARPAHGPDQAGLHAERCLMVDEIRLRKKALRRVQEINSKERDQFWLKEEQEEKKRVAAERERREEEKRRAEEEVRRRDEAEAARRARAEAARGAGGGGGEERGGAGGEGRPSEARRLIGASTAAARALFQQNLAQGQISAKTQSTPEKPLRTSVVAQRIQSLTQGEVKEPKREEQPPPKASPLRNIDKIELSLERPSQIQHEPIEPTDLSPSQEEIPFIQTEPLLKQNILEDELEASYCSSNENDDEDSDDKFSTIKRSPHTKAQELQRQDTVRENINYRRENGATLEDLSPEGMEEEGTIYEDLDDDPGLTARALYDYQAVDESEITFDPGDVITHIEQIDAGWWQGLGPGGRFGLFPANYVQLLPCAPR